MRLGIGRDRNLEIRHPPQPGDQVGGIGDSRRDAAHRPHLAADRRAARRCGARRPAQYCRATSSTSSAARADAGQVGRRHQRGLPHDAGYRGMGAEPCAAAGAVGDRDEARRAAAPAGGCRSRAAAPAPRSWAERTRTTAAAAAGLRRVPAGRRSAGRSASAPASARLESPVRPSEMFVHGFSSPCLARSRQAPIASRPRCADGEPML